MYQRILVPVDGSAAADAGLAEAIRLARTIGATLRIVHVLDLRPQAGGFDTSLGYTGDVIELQRESGTALLKDAASKVREAGVPLETRMVETYAARASELIVAEAASSKAELIVMGTHGRRGVSRLVLGSDAEQVLRHSPVPVLLVHGRPGPPATAA